ncbi:fibulin-7-like [Trichomycterus rosablanca]|uniref:fibulin-7-like n=1 Tax=Trichomycterus rosablanca TaxID=2290929 RepID=UPI002F358F92
MYHGVIFLLMFSTCQILRSHSRDCVSRRELQVTLRHVHKVLIAHETSFLQSVRSFHEKLGMLKNSTFKHSSSISTAKNSTAVCPPPKPLANGRMLGRMFRVGHEVHFLCSPGFQLSGPETRECLDSLMWSGEQPTCKTTEAGKKNATFFSSLISGYVQPSRCIELQGSLHCTCQQGYSIYSQDRGLCTVHYECSHELNMRCERNPCVQGNKACLQAPLSVNFHYMSVVSNMSTPQVLFRVSTARVLGDTLRFGLLGNQGAGHFTMQRVDRQSEELLLVEPVQGPAMLEADVEMSELEKRTLLERYVTKVTLCLFIQLLKWNKARLPKQNCVITLMTTYVYR